MKSESPIVVVLSGSMEPAFHRGDLLFLTQSDGPFEVGDIVVFKYWVGDFAWEQMDEEEREAQQKMVDKEYEAVVERSYMKDVNMHVRVGAKSSTHMSFPLGYCGGKNSEVIGHIYA